MVVYSPKSSDEYRRAIKGYAKKVIHCATAVPDRRVVQLRTISFFKLNFGIQLLYSSGDYCILKFAIEFASYPFCSEQENYYYEYSRHIQYFAVSFFAVHDGLYVVALFQQCRQVFYIIGI